MDELNRTAIHQTQPLPMKSGERKNRPVMDNAHNPFVRERSRLTEKALDKWQQSC